MTDTPATPDPKIDDKTLAEWVVNTCLAFGATVATAYQVAGLFILGVRR